MVLVVFNNYIGSVAAYLLIKKYPQKQFLVIYEWNRVTLLFSKLTGDVAEKDKYKQLFRPLPNVEYQVLIIRTYVISFESTILTTRIPWLKLVKLSNGYFEAKRIYSRLERSKRNMINEVVLSDNLMSMSFFSALPVSVSVIEHGVSSYRMNYKSVGLARAAKTALYFFFPVMRALPKVFYFSAALSAAELRLMNNRVPYTKLISIFDSKYLSNYFSSVGLDNIGEGPLVLDGYSSEANNYLLAYPDFTDDCDSENIYQNIVETINIDSIEVLYVKRHPRNQNQKLDDLRLKLLSRHSVRLVELDLLGIPGERILFYSNLQLVSHYSSLVFYAYYWLGRTSNFLDVPPQYRRLINQEYGFAQDTFFRKCFKNS